MFDVTRVLEQPKVSRPKKIQTELFPHDYDRLDRLCVMYHRSMNRLVSAVLLEFLDQCEAQGLLSVDEEA